MSNRCLSVCVPGANYPSDTDHRGVTHHLIVDIQHEKNLGQIMIYLQGTDDLVPRRPL